MAKRPHLRRPVPVQEVVRGILSPGDRDGLELRQQIRRVWEAVVPAGLADQARLVDLRRKELWVEVSASPWAQELQFLKPKILAALDRALGPERSKTCGCGWERGRRSRGRGCLRSGCWPVLSGSEGRSHSLPVCRADFYNQ